MSEESSEISDRVELPIGIEVEGVRYRHVVIDEMSGVDEELAADKKKTGGNGSKAMTLVLCRSIQAIEGLLEQKKNPNSLVNREWVRKMYQPDRDFLVSRIQLLADKNQTKYTVQCDCGEMYEEDVLLSDIPVIRWPEDDPCELHFELPRGYLEVGKGKKANKLHKKVTMRFPTGADQEAVTPLSRDNAGRAMSALLAATITKLGDLDNVDSDVTKQLKSRDRAYLLNQVRDKLPGLVQWKAAECLSCGADLEPTVDMSGFFG